MQTLSEETIFNPSYWIELTQRIRAPLQLLCHPQTGQLGLAPQGESSPYSLVGILPAIYPEWLGDQAFLKTHQARFPYIVGEMANGIATAQMVVSAVQAGMVGFFGAAGLMPQVVEENLHFIQSQLSGVAESWGSNLIHSPSEPQLEEAIVALYLRRGIRRVSASAYMSLSPHIVHYACKGLQADGLGIRRHNYVLAKISRPEVARHFMSPPPKEMLAALVEKGKLTRDEADLGARLPVAEDITVEADSGGHTDNRPLGSLFPVIQMLAHELQTQYGYSTPLPASARREGSARPPRSPPHLAWAPPTS